MLPPSIDLRPAIASALALMLAHAMPFSSIIPTLRQPANYRERPPAGATLHRHYAHLTARAKALRDALGKVR